jgi:hypothetical protein
LNPLLIALISVVTVVLLAIVAVKYISKRKKQFSPAVPPAGRLNGSNEGSVIVSVLVAESETARRKLSKRTLGLLSKNQQELALEHQVDSVISRFILTR